MLKHVFVLFCCICLFCDGNGKPPVLNSKEKIAVDKLRQSVGSKLTAKHMKSDAYLVKWIRAKEFDVAAAKTALENTLEWRKKIKADNLPFEEYGDLNKKYPLDFTKRDRNGAPIILVSYGEWDIRRKAIEGKLPELNRRLDFLEENAAQLAFNLTGDPTSFAIVDMNGFAVRKHGCVRCVALYITWVIHHELYFPFNFYKLLLINTPSVFEPIIAAMKPFMTASSRDSLKTIGYDRAEWRKSISETVDIDTLPLRYGGTGI